MTPAPPPTPAPRPDTAPGRPELSLVIPAYNETGRLDFAAARLLAAAERGAFDLARTELVVVDDGSTDATAEMAQRLLLDHAPLHRLIRLATNAGKGAAVRAGVAAARGPTVAFIDADMAIDPVQLPELLGALARADVAIGSKALADSSIDGQPTPGRLLGRRAMGRVFNQLVTRTVGLHLSDTQCGFKAFPTPVARLLFHLGAVDRFAFDVAVLRWARRLDLSVVEIPVRWQAAGGSRIRPVADPLSMLADLARIAAGYPHPPAVPALVVTGADPAVVAAAAGPTLPVVVGTGDRVTVLGPLLDPAGLDALTADLEGLPGASLARVALEAGALVALGPFGRRGDGAALPPPG